MGLGDADQPGMGTEKIMTMEDAPTPWQCCSTRTRVEFVGKNRRSQVFFKKMIKKTTHTPHPDRFFPYG